MTIKELLQSVAVLVREREVIDHEGRRMLPGAPEVDALLERWHLASVDELYHDEIGDNDLTESLKDLAENADEIAALDMASLRRLIEAYNGPEVADYVNEYTANQLMELDELIAAANALF